MDQTLITVLRYSITYYQKDLFIFAQYANKHKATALHKAYWLPFLYLCLPFLYLCFYFVLKYFILIYMLCCDWRTLAHVIL